MLGCAGNLPVRVTDMRECPLPTLDRQPLHSFPDQTTSRESETLWVLTKAGSLGRCNKVPQTWWSRPLVTVSYSCGGCACRLSSS